MKRAESKVDRTRQSKLKKLLSQRNDSEKQYSTIEILNFTDKVIPKKVRSLLELGKKNGLGGRPNEAKTFVALDDLFSRFKTVARETGLKETTIATVGAHTTLCGHAINHCYTSDSRVQAFLNFKRENSDVLF